MMDLTTIEDKKELKNMGFLINEKTDTFTANIITVNGIITASQYKCIGEASELFGNGTIKISTNFTIEVQGIPYESINNFIKYIARENLETGGIGAKIRPVVSCIGKECRHGLIDTYSLSEEIQDRIYNKYKNVELPHRFKIAISGCPNDCTKINICEVGIMAKYISSNDDIQSNTYGYKVFIGGKGGKTKTDAIALNKIFTSKEEVFDLIEKAILFYIKYGNPKERFAKTIERIGFEQVEKELLLNK